MHPTGPLWNLCRARHPITTLTELSRPAKIGTPCPIFDCYEGAVQPRLYLTPWPHFACSLDLTFNTSQALPQAVFPTRHPARKTLSTMKLQQTALLGALAALAAAGTNPQTLIGEIPSCLQGCFSNVIAQ